MLFLNQIGTFIGNLRHGIKLCSTQCCLPNKIFNFLNLHVFSDSDGGQSGRKRLTEQQFFLKWGHFANFDSNGDFCANFDANGDFSC